jgi:DNA polymerase-3 subunit gamma/tau
MTKIFAQHCVVVEAEEDTVKLAVAPQHGVMLNNQQQQRIQDALNQYYGKSLKLQIVVQDLNTITPAEKHKAVLAEGQQQALATLMADSGVQVLVNTFEATVVPNSVLLK